MDVVVKYRGRMIRESDVSIIRKLIEENPTASRRELSRKLCEVWSWVQPNGTLCDMVCRGLMLTLERAGHIVLPPVRQRPLNPLAVRRRPQTPEIDKTPIACDLRDLGPLEFRLVRRTAEEPLFNSLIEHHHYLRYTHPVGEQIKYSVYAKDRPVACLSWSSAARHLGPRDRFIGWSREARRRNISLIAYNSRYLVLPWVQVSCLASHILGRMASMVPRDWERIYGHPVYYLETFVHPEREGNLLSGRQLDRAGMDDGAWESRHDQQAQPPAQASAGISTRQALPAITGRLVSAGTAKVAGVTEDGRWV